MRKGGGLTSALSSQSHKQLEEKIEGMTEQSVISGVKRESSALTIAKKNSYQVFNKNKIPDGISGYKAASIKKFNTEQESEGEDADASSTTNPPSSQLKSITNVCDKNRHQPKSITKTPYSPFLKYPMEQSKEHVAFSNVTETDESNFFALEYYMFPMGQNKEDI